METKAISHQPTLLPGFGYFAESGSSSAAAAVAAWHPLPYPGSLSSGGRDHQQQQSPSSPSSQLEFDKDTLGQYIHKIYCRDCRMAEERQRREVEGGRSRMCGGSGETTPLMTVWDQEQTAVGSPPLLHSLFSGDDFGLDREKNKESLKRKLLLRRSANEQVDQEKYPASKSPAPLTEQRKHLQRAQAGNRTKAKTHRHSHADSSELDNTELTSAHSHYEATEQQKRPRLTASEPKDRPPRGPPLRLSPQRLEQQFTPAPATVLGDSARLDGDEESHFVASKAVLTLKQTARETTQTAMTALEGVPTTADPELENALSSPSEFMMSEDGDSSPSVTAFDPPFILSDSAGHHRHANSCGGAADRFSPLSAKLAAATASTSLHTRANGTLCKQQGGRLNKKAKPKAHSKAKVIKFHEYKGPPVLPSLPLSSSSVALSKCNAAGSSCISSGCDPSKSLPCSSVTCSSPLASGPMMMPGAAEMNGADAAQYNLLLRRQQLFLQWQLEFQQNQAMPVLVPIQTLQHPPPQQQADVQQADVQQQPVQKKQAQPDFDASPTSPLLGISQGSPLPATSPQKSPAQIPPILVQGPCEQNTAIQVQPPYTPTKLHQHKKSTSTRVCSSLDDMKIVDLKAELKRQGLHVSGSKQQLIKRLLSHQQDSHSINGDLVAQLPPALSAGGPENPLSEPSSLTSASSSPPSTPLTLSSQGEDGYLTMLSASASSISSIGVDEDECGLLQGDLAFAASPVAVQDEIVRQQQKQIEELQKLLRESQRQLQTQFHTVTDPHMDVSAPVKVKQTRPSTLQATSSGRRQQTASCSKKQVPGEVLPGSGFANVSQPLHFTTAQSRPHAVIENMDVNSNLTAIGPSVAESVQTCKMASAVAANQDQLASISMGTKHSLKSKQEPPKYDEACKQRPRRVDLEPALGAPSNTTMDDVLEMLIAAGSSDMMADSKVADGVKTVLTAPSDSVPSAPPKVHHAGGRPRSASSANAVYAAAASSETTFAFRQAAARQQGPATTYQRCLSPMSLNWSDIADNPTGHDIAGKPVLHCQLSLEVDCDRIVHSESAVTTSQQDLDEAGSLVTFDLDLESNLSTLDFRESESGNNALDWLDVMMPACSSIAMATTGIAATSQPPSFNNDPLLTSNPPSILDLFNMDEADFNTFSDLSCGISWEKFREVTTA